VLKDDFDERFAKGLSSSESRTEHGNLYQDYLGRNNNFLGKISSVHRRISPDFISEKLFWI